MFGIGMTELLIILVVALIFLGPKKLPGIARSLGKGLKEFKKASQEVKASLDLDDDESQGSSYKAETKDSTEFLPLTNRPEGIVENKPEEAKTPEAETINKDS